MASFYSSNRSTLGFTVLSAVGDPNGEAGLSSKVQTGRMTMLGQFKPSNFWISVASYWLDGSCLADR